MAAITGSCGECLSNLTRLADIDLLISDTSGKILLLVEIEERARSPRKLLGDVLAVLLCNRFAVRNRGQQKYFNIEPETRLIIAGIVPGEARRLQKINEVIQPCIASLPAMPDKLDPKHIELIFAENMGDTMQSVLERVEQLFCDATEHGYTQRQPTQSNVANRRYAAHQLS